MEAILAPRRDTLQDHRSEHRHDRGRPASGDPYGHLPPGAFAGRLHVIDTKAKALRASLLLRRERVVGLDTESRPSFRRGEIFPISLVQIATDRHAFIFRMRPGDSYPILTRTIEDPSVRKIVQGAHEEARELRRDFGMEARGFVDLPCVAKAAGYTELNLRALAAAALGIRISKAAQRSDWSRSDLTPAQLEYAATDAWACLAVYRKIGSPAAETVEPSAHPRQETGIRAAGAADAAAIVELVRELAASAGEQTPVSAAQVNAYLTTAGCAVLLAEREGRVLGLVSYSIRPNLYHGRDCCLVEELVVSSAARGKGVGRSLLGAAVREAERRGCAEISVSTLPDNAAALALYRSAGLTDEAVLLERHFAPRPHRRGRRGGRGQSRLGEQRQA